MNTPQSNICHEKGSLDIFSSLHPRGLLPFNSPYSSSSWLPSSYDPSGMYRRCYNGVSTPWEYLGQYLKAPPDHYYDVYGSSSLNGSSSPFLPLNVLMPPVAHSQGPFFPSSLSSGGGESLITPKIEEFTSYSHSLREVKKEVDISLTTDETDSAFEDGALSDFYPCSRTTPNNHKSLHTWSRRRSRTLSSSLIRDFKEGPLSAPGSLTSSWNSPSPNSSKSRNSSLDSILSSFSTHSSPLISKSPKSPIPIGIAVARQRSTLQNVVSSDWDSKSHFSDDSSLTLEVYEDETSIKMEASERDSEPLAKDEIDEVKESQKDENAIHQTPPQFKLSALNDAVHSLECSPISNSEEDLNLNYKSSKVRQQEVAHIATKSQKSPSSEEKAQTVKMEDWEIGMRHNLAEIQRKYKEKYKELYQLTSKKRSRQISCSPSDSAHFKKSKSETQKYNNNNNSNNNNKTQDDKMEPSKYSFNDTFVQKFHPSSTPTSYRWEVKRTSDLSSITNKFKNGRPNPFENLLRLSKVEFPSETFEEPSISPIKIQIKDCFPIDSEKEGDFEKEETEEKNNSVLQFFKKKSKKSKKKNKKKKKKKRRIKTNSNSNSELYLDFDLSDVSHLRHKKEEETKEPFKPKSDILDSNSSCVIKAKDLKEGLRVLTRIGGHFHPSTIRAISPPDIYGVLVDKERGNRPHIYSREEVLQESIFEVKPSNVSDLQKGTRVVAYWSQKYNHLYPGTIGAPSSPNPKIDPKFFVNVELDDGDSRDIHIDNIRFLPPNYPLVYAEPDPMSLGIRRQRTLSSDVSLSTSFPGFSKNHRRVKSLNLSDFKGTITKFKKRGEESNSVMAAFLPPQKLWTWCNSGIKKGRRILHDSIARSNDSESLPLGSCAVFLSTGRPDRPYIGKLEALWENGSGEKKNMRVKVKWFYHASETVGVDETGRKIKDLKLPGALFESCHYDENDVQTISHGCEVVSFLEFSNRFKGTNSASLNDNNDLYYLAGTYDPVHEKISFSPGVVIT